LRARGESLWLLDGWWWPIDGGERLTVGSWIAVVTPMPLEIEPSVADRLPSMVKEALSRLPVEKQATIDVSNVPASDLQWPVLR